MDSPTSSIASNWSTDSDRVYRSVYKSYSSLLRRGDRPVSCPDCGDVMYPRNYPGHRRDCHDPGHDPLVECSFCCDYRWKRNRKMHHGKHLRECLEVFLRDRAARDPDDEEVKDDGVPDDGVQEDRVQEDRVQEDRVQEDPGATLDRVLLAMNARIAVLEDRSVNLLGLMAEIWPALVDGLKRVGDLEDSARRKRARVLDSDDDESE